MKKTHLLLTTLAGLAFAASLPAAVVTLGFDDGTGTASVDQYTGTAGSGWVDAWGQRGDGLITQTDAVSNTTPVVTGGGNYLSIAAELDGGTPGSSGRTSVSTNREYDGGLLTTAVTYSFDVRIDSVTSFSSTNDSINFFDATTNNPTGGFFSTTQSTWGLRFSGDGQIKQGASGGTNVGAAWATGKTYSFTINSDPTTETWGFSIFNVTDNISTASGTGLAWLAAASLSNANGGFLHFGTTLARTAGVPNLPTDGAASWSLDNISITAVPEPSTYALLAGFMALGLILMRRPALSRSKGQLR